MISKLEERDFSTNYAKKGSCETPTVAKKCKIITLAEFQHQLTIFLFLNTPRILLCKEHTWLHTYNKVNAIISKYIAESVLKTQTALTIQRYFVN